MSKREKRPIPTYELVREWFDYRDGALIWRVARSNRVKAGSVAGTVNSHGYIIVGMRMWDCRTYLYAAHRLVYLWHHGYWPENEVDHINRNPSDNRIENLREVSRVCNARNCKIDRRNKLGVTGVRVVREPSIYQADIGVNGKLVVIGYYNSVIDAVIARWNAEVEHNYPGCNSTSSAYQYLLKSGEVFFDGNGQAIKRISEAC